MKSTVIVVLVAALAFTSYRLAHVENHRYALMLGMCKTTPIVDVTCLEKVQTRTSWAWNLYYGLFSEV